MRSDHGQLLKRPLFRDYAANSTSNIVNSHVYYSGKKTECSAIFTTWKNYSYIYILYIETRERDKRERDTI